MPARSSITLPRPAPPSILIETAFLTDKGNLRRLSAAGRERFAQAIPLGRERFYRDAAVGQTGQGSGPGPGSQFNPGQLA